MWPAVAQEEAVGGMADMYVALSITETLMPRDHGQSVAPFSDSRPASFCPNKQMNLAGSP